MANRQVHEHAGHEDDGPLPERQRSGTAGGTRPRYSVVRVRPPGAPRPSAIGRPAPGAPQPPAAASCFFAGRTSRRRPVRVVLVLLRGADSTLPHSASSSERIERLVVGDAAVGGDVLHVRRAAAVQRREHRPPGAGSSRPPPCRTPSRTRPAARPSRRSACPPRVKPTARPRQAQHELRHPHPEGARRQIVPALVDEHQEARARSWRTGSSGQYP